MIARKRDVGSVSTNQKIIDQNYNRFHEFCIPHFSIRPKKKLHCLLWQRALKHDYNVCWRESCHFFCYHLQIFLCYCTVHSLKYKIIVSRHSSNIQTLPSDNFIFFAASLGDQYSVGCSCSSLFFNEVRWSRATETESLFWSNASGKNRFIILFDSHWTL